MRTDFHRNEARPGFSPLRRAFWPGLMCLALGWTSPEGIAQDARPLETPGEVLGRYDLHAEPGRRDEAARELGKAMEARRSLAHDRARKLGLPIRVERPDGGLVELVDFDGDQPLYFTTFNSNAAISIAVNTARTAYALDGGGVLIGMWDGGSGLSTHQEFGSRMLPQDGAASYAHATHVGGTLIASGVTAAAKGMSPAGTVHSYDWNNDLSEMTGRAASAPAQADRLYLSNHSYGYLSGWYYTTGTSPAYIWYGNGTTPAGVAYSFGMYNSMARDTDSLAFSSPYYLVFQSAGNDRGDNPATGQVVQLSPTDPATVAYDAAAHPPGDNLYRGGFETVGYRAVAKNVLTIGAVNDAVSGSSRSLAAATMSTFSCWGPTDDGRIKPDLVANGVSLYSSLNSSDTSYGTFSGTSMSSPNATGGAALLIQHYTGLFPGQAMRASTLKGLLIHTADDLGNPGPDYKFGWGLINIHAAADVISDHQANPSRIRMTEAQVTSSAPTHAYSFYWNGTTPIRATLCWTDPPGDTIGSHDNRASNLKNDLNLRIIGPDGTTYFPYIMPFVGVWTQESMNQNATAGNNTTDNVEQVYLPAPGAGTYQVVVSYSGSLTNSQQAFSLLLTGASGDVAPPAVNSITPASAAQDGGAVSLQISGASFASGAVVTLTRAGQPTVTPFVSALSSGSITGSFDPAGMEVGLWTVRVTNPDGQWGQLADGFEVTPPPPMQITGVSPAGAVSGTAVWMDLSGAALDSATSVRLSRAGGPDIPATDLQMTGGILRCRVNLQGAAAGAWNISASSATASSTLAAAFTVEASLWAESFDGTVTGWSSVSILGANTWSPSTTRSHTPQHSHFATGPSSQTTTALVSPAIFVPAGATGLQFSFWHWYSFQNRYDGGLLEFQVDNGAWKDIVASDTGNSFAKGGYTNTIRNNASNDYKSRSVWTSNSGDVFIETVVNLTNSALYAGKTLRFRWILATDNRTASTGWHVDSMALIGNAPVGNQPPAITAAASSGSTETVTEGDIVFQVIRSDSAVLTVSAGDDGGEAGLSYRWELLSGPGVAVAFSPNEDNAAKATTAQFEAPGDYLAQVTVTDALGANATSQVHLRAVQDPRAVTIQPDTATLAVGQSFPFSATLRDQFGDPMNPQPASFAWSVTGGGTVSAAGVFTATTAGGPYSVIASSGGVSGLATAWVNPAPATVSLSGLTQVYDRMPKVVTVTTDPPGLACQVLYDGSPNPPAAIGTYAVEVTVTDPNYTGGAEGVLEILDDYPAWIAQYDLTGDDALPDADPDKDGMSNRMEKLFDFHPDDPDSRLRTVLEDLSPGLALRVNRVIPEGRFEVFRTLDLMTPWEASSVLSIPARQDDFAHPVELPPGASRAYFFLRFTLPAQP